MWCERVVLVKKLVKPSGIQGRPELPNSHLLHKASKGGDSFTPPAPASACSPSSPPNLKAVMASPMETSACLPPAALMLVPKLTSWSRFENYRQRSPGKYFWKDLSTFCIGTSSDSTSIGWSTSLKDAHEGPDAVWVISVFQSENL